MSFLFPLKKKNPYVSVSNQGQKLRPEGHTKIAEPIRYEEPLSGSDILNRIRAAALHNSKMLLIK